jgi:hypothetical protein
MDNPFLAAGAAHRDDRNRFGTKRLEDDCKDVAPEFSDCLESLLPCRNDHGGDKELYVDIGKIKSSVLQVQMAFPLVPNDLQMPPPPVN